MNHSADFMALCADAQTRVKEVTVEQAENMLGAKQVDYFIDVREADEYQAGHIEGAEHISKGWIEAKIHHLVDDKDANILLYCGGGNRSLIAADNLQKMGYTNVLSMAGGYRGWVGHRS